MNTGMLWFDDSNRSLTLKVEDAVDSLNSQDIYSRN